MKPSEPTPQSASVSRRFRKRHLAVPIVVAILAVAISLTLGWYPQLLALASSRLGLLGTQAEVDDEHDHAHEGKSDEHDHAHEEDQPASETARPASRLGRFNHRHNDADALKLSSQARANIGVQLARVELQSFDRCVTLPGLVVERPGWSTIDITAPMTGAVTRIFGIQGETVSAGQPLFEIRLTHEDLLQVQTDFLRSVEELDVIGREITRLQKVAAEGAIAGKSLLERTYDQQRQEALLRTLREALLLHGLSAEQVSTIERTRTLLRSLTITAPSEDLHHDPASPPRTLQVREINVTQGKFVTAGDTLCVLADYQDLYIEGQAFERDLMAINRVSQSGRPVSVSFAGEEADRTTLEDLKILYMDDAVDSESRTFQFYIALHNTISHEGHGPDGHRFVNWQFRPGQRCQVRLPVERWENRIVLPIEAVATDGVDSYVFEANGDHFDRRAVAVEYRDEKSAVIANDGSLRLGVQVARSAAHQMQMALKNKAGGAIDPHAGHNH